MQYKGGGERERRGYSFHEPELALCLGDPTWLGKDQRTSMMIALTLEEYILGLMLSQIA